METMPSSRLYGLGPNTMIEILRERVDERDDVLYLYDEELQTKSYRAATIEDKCMDALVSALHRGSPQAQASANDWRLTFDYYDHKAIFKEGAWQALCTRMAKWKQGFSKIAEADAARYEVVMLRPRGAKSWRFVGARSVEPEQFDPESYDPQAHWTKLLQLEQLDEELDLLVQTFFVLEVRHSMVARVLFGQLKLHEKMTNPHRKVALDNVGQYCYGFEDPIEDDEWTCAVEEAEEALEWIADERSNDSDDYDCDDCGDVIHEPVAKTLISLMKKAI